MPIATINDVQLYFEAGGSAPPVLFVTGMANVLEWHRAVFERLDDRFSYAAFDYPGCGRSGPTTSYEVSSLADVSFALMDDLDHERFSVVGLSMGGQVTQEMLVRRTGRIERAVLLASGPARASDALHRSLEGGTSGIANAAEMTPEERVRAGASAIFSDDFLASERFERWLEWQTPLAAPAECIARYAHGALRHDVIARLPTIDVPTLVVAATDDTIVLHTSSDEIAAAIPRSQFLRLHGGSHGFVLEHPAWAADTIAGFLTSELDMFPAAAL